MPTSPSIFDRCRSVCRSIVAALSLFTRLPFWRLCSLSAADYAHVVPFWPLVGLLSGGVMLSVFTLALFVGFRSFAVVLMAFALRVILTGALHEDGFADFCDGFGGGSSKERVLQIMKDSHIGTYAVIALVIYFLLLPYVVIRSFDLGCSVAVLLVADVFCKFLSSSIIWFLPYARPASDAKVGLQYEVPSWRLRLLSAVIGFAPLVVLAFLTPLASHVISFVVAAVAAAFSCALLFRLFRCRIGGYTGDCCGATFIISEFVFHFALCVSLSIFHRLL